MRRVLILAVSIIVVLGAILGPLQPDFRRAWSCRCDSCCVVLDRFPITTAIAVKFERG